MKRVRAGLSAMVAVGLVLAAGLLMARIAPTTAGTPLYGDPSCDGLVNSIDAAFVLQNTAGLLPELPCPENGDVNLDGSATSVDASLILQFVAGLLDILGPSIPSATPTSPPPTATPTSIPPTATSTATGATLPTTTPLPSATPTTTPAGAATPKPTVTPTRTPTTSPTRTPTSVPTSTATAATNCDAAYPTVCIPPPPPDLNCGDIEFQDFVVLPPDPHGFDGNNDGIGCQS